MGSHGVRDILEDMFSIYHLFICFLVFLCPTVRALKCFSDVATDEGSRCEQRKGFRSCFIKYDQGGGVSGRGCSTKHQIFSTLCENHVMGGSGSGEERKCSDPFSNEKHRIFLR